MLPEARRPTRVFSPALFSGQQHPKSLHAPRHASRATHRAHAELLANPSSCWHRPRRRNRQERSGASRQEQRQEHRKAARQAPEGIAPRATADGVTRTKPVSHGGLRSSPTRRQPVANPSSTRRKPVANPSPTRRHRAECRPGLHCPAPPASPRAWACGRMRLTQVVTDHAVCIADSTNHTPTGHVPTDSNANSNAACSPADQLRRHTQVPPSVWAHARGEVVSRVVGCSQSRGGHDGISFKVLLRG